MILSDTATNSGVTRRASPIANDLASVDQRFPRPTIRVAITVAEGEVVYLPDRTVAKQPSYEYRTNQARIEAVVQEPRPTPHGHEDGEARAIHSTDPANPTRTLPIRTVETDTNDLRVGAAGGRARRIGRPGRTHERSPLHGIATRLSAREVDVREHDDRCFGALRAPRRMERLQVHLDAGASIHPSSDPTGHVSHRAGGDERSSRCTRVRRFDRDDPSRQGGLDGMTDHERDACLSLEVRVRHK